MRNGENDAEGSEDITEKMPALRHPDDGDQEPIAAADQKNPPSMTGKHKAGAHHVESHG